MPQQLERKSLPFELKAADGGSFEGYAACFGNIDAGGDIIDPGAFTDTLDYFLPKGIIALYHDWERPIGKPTKATADARGLFIGAKLSDVPDAEVARTLMKDGVIQSLSIGYRTQKRQWIEQSTDVEEYWRSIRYNPTEDDLQALKQGWGVRVLLKVKLYETSTVPFPMNDQCDITAAKGLLPAGMTFDAHSDAVLATCEEFLARAKDLAHLRQTDGRGLSPERRSQIKAMRDRFDALLQEAEPKADAAAIDQLYLQFLETEARLKGVAV
jgi:HK97 family phage prohead protease